MYIESALLFKEYKVVVPFSLGNEMLLLIHERHFGFEKSKNRAREIILAWHVSKHRNLVIKCEVSEKFQKANVKDFLLMHVIPNRPFEKLDIDIMK